MGVGKEIRNSSEKQDAFSSDEDSEDELMQAVNGLSGIDLNSVWSDAPTNGKYSSYVNYLRILTDM